MGYRLDGWGSIPGRGEEIFLFSHSVQADPEAHPASYPIGTEVPLPGGKVARV
jgi:tagatose-1,6-bisphosphate aldolase non-catalytic subunit AgaZ/GatZ